MTGFVKELRRRRVLTTAGLYVVGAWLVMQAADVFFPGWGIPDTGINVLLIAAQQVVFLCPTGLQELERQLWVVDLSKTSLEIAGGIAAITAQTRLMIETALS